MVEPALMRDIVKSFGVRYNHNGARFGATRDVLGLSRRDEHGENQFISFSYNPDIDAHFPLFPPNTTLDNDVAVAVIRYIAVSIIFMVVFHSNNRDSQLTDAQVVLTCVDCKFTMNITIGMDFQVDITNSSCVTSSQNCFTFNNAAMNFTIHQFELDAALEVFTGDELQAGVDYKYAEPMFRGNSF